MGAVTLTRGERMRQSSKSEVEVLPSIYVIYNSIREVRGKAENDGTHAREGWVNVVLGLCGSEIENRIIS